MNKQFYEACKKGDLELCVLLFKKGARLTIGPRERTLMFLACQNGHLSVCKWLYKVGADADITKADIKGVTPMSIACLRGHLSVCKWLYKVGADEDIIKVDNDGDTPMHVACTKGHLSVCEWLYEMGTTEDISKVNQWGYTPMLLACMNGHLSVCEWLFKMGTTEDIRKVSNIGGTPMYYACLRGELSVCEWLFKMGATLDIHLPTLRGQSPFKAALLRLSILTASCLTAQEDIYRYVKVCKWLVINGALNTNLHHPIRGCNSEEKRILNFLSNWAKEVVEAHDIFRTVFIPGTHFQRKSDHLWMLNSQGPAFSRLFKTLIAEFACGVKGGKELGNVRKLEVLELADIS